LANELSASLNPVVQPVHESDAGASVEMDRASTPDFFRDVEDECEQPMTVVNSAEHEDASSENTITDSLNEMPVELVPTSGFEAEAVFLGVTGDNGSHIDQELLREFFLQFSNVVKVDAFDERMTHLVVLNSEGRLCKERSVKYVFAIANRCYIVSREWLADSARLKAILGWVPFEIVGDVSVNPLASAARLSRHAAARSLMAGHHFFLAATFFTTHTITREQLVQLLELVGGVVVSQLWQLGEDAERDHIIFGYQSRRVNSAIKFECDTRLRVLAADWILDCIAEFRVLDAPLYRVASDEFQSRIRV